MEITKENLFKGFQAVRITSDVETGSSVCMRFRISATRTDAFPLALTFGISPKVNYII